MATFTIAFDGTRVVDASTTTGWTADSATPVAEPDFFYQGTGSISAKIKTAEIGFYYTSSSQDLTTPRVALLKVLATNKDVLDGNGFVVRIGSSTSAYYQYNNVFTSTTYPIPGGWQIVAIDPNVSQWRSSTTGSPNLAAVIYWAFRADFSATSKAENMAADAIDYVTRGAGLTATRGDSTDPDGTMALILAADEGNATNRWGIIQSRDGIYYINAVITIGASGTATSFTDSNQVLVFPNHRVTNGFCGIDFNIQNASTVLSATSFFFSGRGALSSSDDTRPDYTIVGSSGTLDVSSSTFSVFRQIDWNSKVNAQSTVYINGLKIVGDAADLRGSKFTGCTGAADVSYLFWGTNVDTDGLLDNCLFTKGSTATHAIELGTSSPLTITLRNVTFTSYNGSNNQNDSTIYVKRAAGVVTINIVGGTTPSYKTDGATVIISLAPVTVSVTVKDVSTGSAIQNARVLARAATGGDIAFQKSTTITRLLTIATATCTAHGLVTNDYALISGANQAEYNGLFQVTVLTTDTFTFVVSGSPASPATGTIITTGVLLNGLTNASGVISATRVYTSTQPFTGTARKASSGDNPLYKPGAISDTVSTSTGFTGTILLVRDQ